MVNKLKLLNMVNGSTVALDKSGATGMVLDSVDWGVPSQTNHTYRLPYQIGQTFQEVELGTRQVAITGYAIGTENISDYNGRTWGEYWQAQEQSVEAKKEVLNRIINPYQDVQIMVGDFFLTGRPMQAILYSVNESENNDVFCQFSISIECYNPMFVKANSRVDYLATTRGMFVFPWRIKQTGNVMGAVSSRKLVNIQNNGDINVGGIIRISANGGSVSNPRIFNVYTQEFMEFNVALDDGDYMIINTNHGQENAIVHYVDYYGDGMLETSALPDMIEGSSFFQFKQGTNVYGWEVDSGENFVQISVETTEQYFNIKEM